MSAPTQPTGGPAPSGLAVAVVRYSLPTLLAEVQLERHAPAFSGEKLDQVEIAKLFPKTRSRRVLKNRKQ
jgi:hypothetical protein